MSYEVLDAEFRRAEASLPEGWYLIGVMRGPDRRYFVEACALRSPRRTLGAGSHSFDEAVGELVAAIQRFDREEARVARN